MKTFTLLLSTTLYLLNLSLSFAQNEVTEWNYTQEKGEEGKKRFNEVEKQAITYFHNEDGYTFLGNNYKCTHRKEFLLSPNWVCENNIKIIYTPGEGAKLMITRRIVSSIRLFGVLSYRNVDCCVMTICYKGKASGRFMPTIRVGNFRNKRNDVSLLDKNYSDNFILSSPYPNPSATAVKLDAFVSENELPATVVIHDLVGQKVYEAHTTLNEGINTFNIDVSNFNSGYYIYTVSVGQERKTGKLSVEH